MHMDALNFLPFDSPFYRNILGQADSQTKKQTCIQKKIKVKEASACQKAILQMCFLFLAPVHKYVWTLATSCHAKTSRNGLHHWWTRSGLVLFISLLISQELKLSRSAQPGCNVQASVPYSLLGDWSSIWSSFHCSTMFPFVILSHQCYWLLIISDLFCLVCLHASSFWSPLGLAPLGL